MKTILMAIMAAALPVGALAETGSDVAMLNPPPQAPEVQLKQMTEKLNLTTQQQGKIGPILQSESQQRRTIDADSTMKPDRKKVAIAMVHQYAQQQIHEVLSTPPPTGAPPAAHP